MSEDKKNDPDIFERVFGKAPAEGYEFRHLSYGLGNSAVCISWSCTGIGFGGLNLLFTEQGLDMDTEMMGDKFVLAALNELIRRVDLGQKAVTWTFEAEDGPKEIDVDHGNEGFIKGIAQTFKFYVEQRLLEQAKTDKKEDPAK